LSEPRSCYMCQRTESQVEFYDNHGKKLPCKPCWRAYQRDRTAKVKAGTWSFKTKPKPKPAPKPVIDDTTEAHCAGILEAAASVVAKVRYAHHALDVLTWHWGKAA
jgi:hypothetical protein